MSEDLILRVKVDNLPWKTRDEELKNLFDKEVGNVKEANVVLKSNGLSKGIGYVTFSDVESASQAVKKMNNYEYDNRPLGVISDPPRKQRVPVDGEESNKLHVRNLDRSLTKAEIKEKFEEYGKCKVDFKKNNKNCYANITFTEDKGKEQAGKAKATLNDTNAFGEEKPKIIVVYVKNKTQPRAKKTTKKNNKNQPKQQEKKNKKKAKKVEPKKEVNEEKEPAAEKEKKPWKRRLFVNKLATNVKKEDVENLFKKYGTVTNVQLPVDQETEKIRGFCYVQMADPVHALTAKEEIHKTNFNGEELEVYWARPRKRKRITNRDNRKGKGGQKKK